MNRPLRKGIAVLALATLVGGQVGGGAVAWADQREHDDHDTVTPIKHVIVIIGENRTFDNLYGTYVPRHGQHVLNLLSQGIVRFCGTNTGQDVPDTSATGDNHWGEVYCLRDGTIANAALTTTSTQTISSVSYSVLTGTVPEYQALVMGNREFAMMDNLAYQPARGFWVMNEDGEGPTYATKRNNDIWACLDDGEDADKLSDACVKLMTLNDLTAESTGGVFDATGTRYFVSIQHNLTGHGIILEVNGWL